MSVTSLVMPRAAGRSLGLWLGLAALLVVAFDPLIGLGGGALVLLARFAGSAVRGSRQRAIPRSAGAGFDLAAASRAEIQLCRAGRLRLFPSRCGAVWLGRQTRFCDIRLGDPVCPPQAAPQPLRPADFVTGTGHRFFYKVGGRVAVRARAAGLVVLPFAQEAVLAPTRFTTSGAARAGLRRKLSHAARAGIIISADETLPLREMAEVHRAWLGKRRYERGFSMGRWDAGYVSGQRVFLARDAQGQLAAWISFHASQGEWVLDLLRYRPDVADGTLYALIVAAIRAAAASRVARLSLAAVLCPGGRGIYGHGLARAAGRMRGLQQFKAAFRPRWEPRYLAASSWTALWLGLMICALGIHRSGSG